MQNVAPQPPRPSIGRMARVVATLLPLLVFALAAFIYSLYLQLGGEKLFSHEGLSTAARELAFAFLIGFLVAVVIGLPESMSREREFQELRNFIFGELTNNREIIKKEIGEQGKTRDEEFRQLKKDFLAIRDDVVRNMELSRESRRMGIRRVYLRRQDAARDVISDVGRSKSSCRLYVGVFFPELFDTNLDDFANALAEAASRHVESKTGSSRELPENLLQTEKYRLSFTCLNWSRSGPQEISFL